MAIQRPEFSKKLTKTDVGKRGPDGKKSNQSGVVISKNSINTFPFLNPMEVNPEAAIIAVDGQGVRIDLRFIYFNGKLHGINSRNEYRITGLGAYLRDQKADIGDKFTMRPLSDGSYHLTVQSMPVNIGMYDADDEIVEAEDDNPWERVILSIKRRRGQVRFRENLLNVYDKKCAISGHGPIDVLEAAHIEPHSVSGHNAVKNGLLLRADLHTLMDAGLLVINPDNMKILIHRRLIRSPYEALINTRLRTPKKGPGPSVSFLRDRYDSLVSGNRMNFFPLP